MNPLRMQQIFGNKSPVKQESNYPMYNEFLRSIAPMLHARRREAEGRENAELDTQRSISNRAIPSPIEQRLPIQQEEKPMNVRFDPSGGRGMTPYQEAQLALSGRRIEQGGDIADRRMDLAEAGGSRLDQIAAQGANRTGQIAQTADAAMDRLGVTNTANQARDLSRETARSNQIDQTAGHAMDRVNRGGEIATGRDTTREAAAMARVNRQAEIQTKLLELRNTNSVEAAKVKAELERELIDLRGQEARETKMAPSAQQPMPPSQERIASLNKAQQTVNTHPEWRDFITITGNGFVVKPSGDPRVDEQIKAAIYGKGDIALPGENPGLGFQPSVTQAPVANEAPPAGALPGGKWIVTKSGRRIYQEP